MSASRARCRAASAVTRMKQLSAGCRRSTRSRQASTSASARNRPCAIAAAASRSVSAVGSFTRRPSRHPARAAGKTASLVSSNGRRPQQQPAAVVECARASAQRPGRFPPRLTLTPLLARTLRKRRLADPVVSRLAHARDLRRQRTVHRFQCVAHLRTALGGRRSSVPRGEIGASGMTRTRATKPSCTACAKGAAGRARRVRRDFRQDRRSNGF